MKITIIEPAPVVTMEMDSRMAPCHECLYFQRPRDNDGVSMCTRANMGLSGKVIEDCLQNAWFTKATE